MNTTPETAGYTYADWVTGEPVVPFEVAARLEQERNKARDELADIRQRLKGHPDSKLDGENGLAAATMRGFDGFQVENEAMRTAIKEAHAALESCQEDTCELIAERDWWKNEPRCGYSARWAEMNVRFAKAVAALAKLQPFLKP